MARSITDAFSDSAADYVATMVPALRPVAAEVVRRARLQPGERVLDIGTGTGSGAEAAVGDGRQVVGVDAAEGMLEIARDNVPAATFVRGDFTALPFGAGVFHALLAVHCLHFAPEPVAALAEWRRVTRAGGRLSLSVPGPGEATSAPIYEPIHRAFGISGGRAYPTEALLREWAESAGWQDVETGADELVTIRLVRDEDFDRWMATGSRGQATGSWSAERKRALRDAMLAVTPRDENGHLVIPFGALFLAARNP